MDTNLPGHKNDRRNFFKLAGLSSLPLFLPRMAWAEETVRETVAEEKKFPVNFLSDGLFFFPTEYIQKLKEINDTKPFDPDFYGNGGVTQQLEEAFAKLTGKEKAIYVPTGTMANQLALKMLSGENTKVVVPENSHIFRDEADAAQSVHEKRLVPAGKDKPYFTQKDLENTIAYHDGGEVFHSGWGAVAVENPIRRADGVGIPISTIREISTYCKNKGYKLHLDGARIHIASAYSGVSVAEYASHFDTVYISLYKYLNAAGGAMLCGPAELIDKLHHRIKIHGGTVFQTWTSSAMALHYLEGVEERWKNVIKTMDTLMGELNKIQGIKIAKIPEGTNIYDMTLAPDINLKKMAGILYNEHQILVGRANEKGVVKLMVNDSLLTRNLGEIVQAFKTASSGI